jgi:hypothetical protein
MPEGSYLCKNLKLTIRLEPDEQLRLSLSNPMSMNEVELLYPVRPDDLKKPGFQERRRYHLGEALVIAVRQLLSQGVKEGLITLPSIPPGTPTSSSVAPKSLEPDWDLNSSIPEDF